MVRRKIQMKRIENKSSRQVTFSKRRNGMLKKAFELSVLCEVEVALIIFSSRGKLYEFSSSSVQETIERYRNYVRDSQKANPYLGQNMEHLKQQTASMKKMIDGLEASKRKLSGENLNSCSLQELQELEEQLRKSVKKVQERKNQVFKEKMEKLKEKGKAQTDENARLSVKLASMRKQARQINLSENPASTSEINISSPDVETDLFIGLPERRT